MFLRVCGRQILILHSYRDGLRRVRHHLLGSIRAQDTQTALELRWKELYRLYPTSQQRAQELWEQTLTLWRQLPQLPGPTPHERFTPRNTDCASVTQYAQTLYEFGRIQECWDEMNRLPINDGWAQANKAALLWRNGQAVEAFDAMMAGLARAPEILPGLDDLQRGWKASPNSYWGLYGELWSQDGQRFLLQLWNQTLVKFRTARVREGQRPRRLIKDHSRSWVLQRLRLAA